MTQRLQLLEPSAAADLDTFLGRASSVQDGSVRVIVAGGALAVYAPVLQPAGLLDEQSTVLALRVVGIRDEGLDIDRVVSIQALREAIAADASIELPPPTPVYAVTWAGVVPPRTGWSHVGEIDSGLLASTATEGIREVAEALPDQAGDPVVREVRARVWDAAIPGAEALPRGAALAAHAFGFLPRSGVEQASIHQVGPWSRLSLARGHVLVKRRAWSLAG